MRTGRAWGVLLAFALLSAPQAVTRDDGGSDQAFILRGVDGSTQMIGSIEDLKHARAAFRGDAARRLWTRIDGKEYVVSDPETLARARAIFERSEPLDERQAALEREMEALERRGEGMADQERALDRRQEALDDEHDRTSNGMTRDLDALVREAIRTGKAARP